LVDERNYLMTTEPSIPRPPLEKFLFVMILRPEFIGSNALYLFCEANKALIRSEAFFPRKLRNAKNSPEEFLTENLIVSGI